MVLFLHDLGYALVADAGELGNVAVCLAARHRVPDRLVKASASILKLLTAALDPPQISLGHVPMFPVSPATPARPFPGHLSSLLDEPTANHSFEGVRRP